MLAERLEEAWRTRRASVALDAVMRFSDQGLMLGWGTVLAHAGPSAWTVDIDELDPRLIALLAAAHLRTPSATSLTHLRKAAESRREGDAALAAMHLALSRLDRLGQPDADARRLFLADGLLEAGFEAGAIHKALGLDLAVLGELIKYNPDQPRVPAGSGRPSGEWTATGAAPPAVNSVATRRRRAVHSARPRARAARPPNAKPSPTGRPTTLRPTPGRAAQAPVASRPGANVSPATVATAVGVAISGSGARLELGGLSRVALARLATFLAGFGEASALATTAGVATFLGVLFIPNTGETGKWVRVGGPGDVSYFLPKNERGVGFQYTTADGVRHRWTADPSGPGGSYPGPNGDIVARWVKAGAKAGLVVSTAALLGSETNEERLCPAPGPDNGGALGRAYEDFAKGLFNPGNPTPSGLVYGFPNPAAGDKIVKIDDCQQQSGELAEYKGPGYAEHLHKKDFIWDNMLADMVKQATNQVNASEGRHLTWFFDERSIADRVRTVFKAHEPNIDVEWLPMTGERK